MVVVGDVNERSENSGGSCHGHWSAVSRFPHNALHFYQTVIRLFIMEIGLRDV